MCWHVSDGSATQKQSENIRKGHRFGAHFHIHKVTFNSGYVQMKVNFGAPWEGSRQREFAFRLQMKST